MIVEFASDSSLMVRLSGTPSRETSLKIVSLLHHLHKTLGSAATGFHPAFCSLLLDFDPRAQPGHSVKAAVEEALRTFVPAVEFAGKLVTVAVQYDGEDLAEVAKVCGVSESEVVKIHSSVEYTVAFLGFVPGFPYLIGLPKILQVPRKKTPRVRVPAGSVAVAGAVSGIYPRECPGGWNLIGHTNEIPQLQPGDRVRFQPQISDIGYPISDISTGVQSSEYRVEKNPRLCVLTNVAADPLAHRMGNFLVSNSPGGAALEVTAVGEVEVLFLRDTWFAVTGADCAPKLDQIPVKMWASLPVSAGQRLTLSPATVNFRSYVCVHSATGSPGYERTAEAVQEIYRRGQEVLRVTRGPQREWFTGFTSEFSVTADLNRLGVRLSGAKIEWDGRELESEGISDGAIQVPPDGQPVILFCEQRTTGGYPKIANVVAADLFKIGQLRPGQKLRLHEISLEDAWALLI